MLASNLEQESTLSSVPPTGQASQVRLNSVASMVTSLISSEIQDSINTARR